eukprot:scaffold1658_cov393-Prasinococcus_capsulatus_cf.AAC.8
MDALVSVGGARDSELRPARQPAVGGPLPRVAPPEATGDAVRSYTHTYGRRAPSKASNEVN